MSLLKRIRNLWNLSEVDFSDSNIKQEFSTIDPGFTINPINTSYQYEGEPRGQIIKRKPVDPIEEAIKQDE